MLICHMSCIHTHIHTDDMPWVNAYEFMTYSYIFGYVAFKHLDMSCILMMRMGNAYMAHHSYV